MPFNPKIAIFKNTEERFEVPLRTKLRHSYPVDGGPRSSFQQQPNPNICQNCYVPHSPCCDFNEDDRDLGCNKSVRRKRNASDDPTISVDRRRKKAQSSHRSSKEKNSASNNSRRLTDYFLAHDGTEGLVQELEEQARRVRARRCRGRPVDARGEALLADCFVQPIPKICVVQCVKTWMSKKFSASKKFIDNGNESFHLDVQWLTES